ERLRDTGLLDQLLELARVDGRNVLFEEGDTTEEIDAMDLESLVRIAFEDADEAIGSNEGGRDEYHA
ncbi:MAG TPA: hypothetical protein VIJ33_10150, partial [Solirubrobacteraceae bacterium]